MTRRTPLGVVAAAAAALALTACSGGSVTGLHGSATGLPAPTALDTATGTPAAGATAAAPTVTSSAAPAAPITAWRACGGKTNGADQCASLQVPLDASAPTGTKLTLALIRRAATSRSQRIGSLILNPGGPGGSTVTDFDGLADQLSVTLRTRFDIVGFDPRGVGKSTPSIQCVNGATADRLNADSPDPTTAAGKAQIESDAKAVIDACVTNSGAALLQHIGTMDAARDIDAVRAAVGDEKTTYLGYSYGTFLGAAYASEYPNRVRALVLDGAVDPGLNNTQGTEVQAAGFESSLKAFLADCQSRGSACGWHPGGNLLTAYRTLLSGIAAHPLATNDRARPLTLTLAQNGVAATLYSKDSWTYLEQGLAQAQQGNGTILLALSDFLTERDSSGQYSNLDAALLAVNCRDEFQPAGLDPVLASYRRLQQTAPDFAAFALSEYACGIWPFRPATQPDLKVTGAPPIVVIGGTGDPATPISEAHGLAARISGSRLLVRNGEGHTSYGSSSCVRGYVDSYLINPSTLPPVGKVCASD